MAKDRFSLHPGERILLKESCVRHGFWTPYTDELVLTTERIIHVKLGIFTNFKGTVDYYLSDINQAIIGEASNGEKQLEIYHNGEKEDFAFESGNMRTLQIWSMAISDRFSEDADIFDFNYYQSLSDESLESIINRSTTDDDRDLRSGIDGKLVGDVVKNVIKSGNYSVDGIAKGAKKAFKQQAKSSLFSDIADEWKDELGITDIKDEFTEIGNEFREAFGLKPKKTQAQVKEERLNAAFKLKQSEARAKATEKKQTQEFSSSQKQTKTNSDGLEKQLDMLKKLKELFDAGVLNQEEFETKKKEILKP